MSEEAEGTRKPNLLLRQQREQSGWSQKRVAEELRLHFPEVAVSENDVKRWESGKRKPAPYYREKLCIIFGTTHQN
jgi:transcriptional regulator with XRE-family HTH domain